MKKHLTAIRGRLSGLIEAVPLELKDSFDQYLLKNSLFRIKAYIIVMCVSFVFQGLLLLYVLSASDRTFESVLEVMPMSWYKPISIIGVMLLFFFFTRYFSRKNNRAMLWLCCYMCVIAFVVNVLIDMYHVDNETMLLGNFTLTLFVFLFVPDFKRFLLPAFVFYLLTALMASLYSIPYMAEFQMILFILAVLMCGVKISHYNGKAKVFVETWRLKELNEKLEALSVTDELTQLHNRRSFMDYTAFIWKQAERLRLPVNALMIDVDYFKKYNDSLGHLEGDKALVAVAQCLKSQLKRETDFAARYGGEEFVCLLTYANQEYTGSFAEKLVQSIESLNIPHPGSECSPFLTVSVGVASVVPNESTSPKDLLDEADKALYAAKQSGRNRAVISRMEDNRINNAPDEAGMM
jgi:diguanylate cyclase (GGDEF)-like protein